MLKEKTILIIRVILLLGTAISLFFVPWVLVWAWILPLPDTMQKQATETLAHGFDGIIVYVDQQGEPSAFYAAGWHDREIKIPAQKDAFFKIASVSKLYDAVAITKLVKAGRLSLDRTLGEYIPELRGRIENADKITLKMMIQHRSGIPNYTASPNYWAKPAESFEKKLELILDMPANFEPDEDYEYCNTNYLLLNKIMDNTLGYKNFHYIKESILNPLQLNNTFASINDVNIEDVMSGYHKGHDADLKSDDRGMIATAKDVGIFLRALNDGSLLTESEQKIYSSLYKYNHSGWVPGYESFAEYHEDIDTIIVTFYSTTDSDLIMWNLAEIINNRFVKILKKINSAKT